MSFEKFIVDASKSTHLDYSYFSTAGEVSRYSSLMPWNLIHVRDAMLKEIPDAKQIIDLTAHIGVDSVHFGVLYPNAKIISLESNLEFYLLLKDNLLKYSTNSECLNADSTQLLDDPVVTSSDVVYLDPEWGGHGYQKDTIKLCIGDTSVEEVIRKCLQNNVKVVILKGPCNLFTDDLYNLGLINEMKVDVHKYKIYTKPQGGKLSYLLYFFRLI